MQPYSQISKLGHFDFNHDPQTLPQHMKNHVSKIQETSLLIQHYIINVILFEYTTMEQKYKSLTLLGFKKEISVWPVNNFRLNN